MADLPYVFPHRGSFDLQTPENKGVFKKDEGTFPTQEVFTKYIGRFGKKKGARKMLEGESFLPGMIENMELREFVSSLRG